MPQENSSQSFLEKLGNRRAGQRMTQAVKAIAAHLAQSADKGQAPDAQAVQNMLGGLDQNVRPIARAHAEHLVNEARELVDGAHVRNDATITQALRLLVDGRSGNHIGVRRGAGR
jgi:hypothetical protein